MLFALYNGQAELVGPILDANPALDVFDAAAVGRTRGLEELLVAEPALVHARTADGSTPLHLAARFGQRDAAELLLEHGADPDARDGWRPERPRRWPAARRASYSAPAARPGSSSVSWR